MLEPQRCFARVQTHRAMTEYYSRFDSRLFSDATASHSYQYANALLDDAMALCGHPYFRLSCRRYAEAAVAFLQRFALKD